MESNNPALKRVPKGLGETASMGGIINKTIILSLIIGLGAWMGNTVMPTMSQGMLFGVLIANFIVSIVYIFNPTLYFLAPLYAISEGVLLYSISATYEAIYPGIVTNALMSTVAVFGAMLFVYKSGRIRVTSGFKKFMSIALISILVLYIGSFLASMFGANISFLTGNSNLSIGISIGVIIIASLTLILDFNRMEEVVQQGADVRYEWYVSFGLILSLVWIYLEILRLLAKLRSRD